MLNEILAPEGFEKMKSNYASSNDPSLRGSMLKKQMTSLEEDESDCSQPSSDDVVAFDDVNREKEIKVQNTNETRPFSRPTNHGSTYE